MTDFGAIMRNISNQIILAAYNFDIPPANLEKAVDGDKNNPTGWGETTKGAASGYGDLKITFPGDGRYLFSMKIEAYMAAGTFYFEDISRYNSGFHNYNVVRGYSWDRVSGNPFDIGSVIYGCKEVQCHLYVSAETTLYFRVWDLAVWNMP